MPQQKFRSKLLSGLYATGLIDILSGTRELPRSKSYEYMYEFLREIESLSTDVLELEQYYVIVDKVLSDPKYKYIIAVYGCKVY